ncbi:hypothetical protein Droror1_Dr00022572 [Drosera rotundifolia]
MKQFTVFYDGYSCPAAEGVFDPWCWTSKVNSSSNCSKECCVGGFGGNSKESNTACPVIVRGILRSCLCLLHVWKLSEFWKINTRSSSRVACPVIVEKELHWGHLLLWLFKV